MARSLYVTAAQPYSGKSALALGIYEGMLRRSPDVAIFRIAERAAGMSGRRILHVGNDVEADVWGAAAAGWSTALRRTPHAPAGSGADFEFDETEQLLEFVR